MAMATYHLNNPRDRMMFGSRNWITIEDFDAWLDLVESTNINYVQARQQLLLGLESVKFKPDRLAQINIVTYIIPLHEEPYRSIMVRLRANLNRQQGNSSTVLNRSGHGVVDIVAQNHNADMNLSHGFLLQNLRDAMSNELYIYDQNRFDTRFDLH